MRAREFIVESFIFESYSLARTEFIRAATAKFEPEAVAKIGTKDEPKEVTQEINNVKQLLDQHRDLAKKNQFRNPEEKDINHWRGQGWDAFSKMIKLKSSDITDSQRKRGKVVGNAITLQDDSAWDVIIPLDKEASVHYGRDTSWCTTKPNLGYFEQYVYRDKITLIYAIPKDTESDNHVAIALYPDGITRMFNKADDPIDAQQYTQISGLDSAEFVKTAKLPNVNQQFETFRAKYNQAVEDTKKLLAADTLDHEAVERALKITKLDNDCYRYILAYYKEQNIPVTVHPIVLASAANYISSDEKQRSITLGKCIDFSKISNSTIKSIVRSHPQLFIYNFKLLSKEQQQLLITSPTSAYYYTLVVLEGKRFPEVESLIATDATASFQYARDIIKGPFPAGEPAIRKNNDNALKYTKQCCLEGSKTWEDLIKDNVKLSFTYIMSSNRQPPELIKKITQNAETAYAYAKKLDRPFPEGEPAIAKSELFAPSYFTTILKNKPSNSWENLIKNDAKQSLEYAIAIKKPFPAGEKVIASHPQIAYDYAIEVLGKKRFPAGEAAIATDSALSMRYVQNVLNGKEFPAGEVAIATNPLLAANYAIRVKKNRWPKGEAAIATDSKANDMYQKFVASIPPLINREDLKMYRTSIPIQLLSQENAKTAKYWMTSYRLEPVGPFSAGDILNQIKKRQINPEGNILIAWRSGLERWVPLQDLLSEIDPNKAKPAIKNTNNSNQPPPLDVAEPSTTNYYILNDKEKTGPYSIRDMVKRIGTPEITKDSKVWKPGMTSWQPFSAIKADILNVITN